MTVITSPSSSATASAASASVGTTTVGSALPTQTGDDVDMSNLIVLLQKTNQALRDTLQKRSVSQMQNSYQMAVKSVENKQQAASETKEATLINSLAGGLGGFVGGGLGLGGLKGGNWDIVGKAGVAAVPALGTAIGNLVSMGNTQAASRLQIGADYINDSKNIYDKQSDVDGNNMRMFSQKITDTTRSLTDLYGAMLNAASWK
ncbi:hypothetical protein MUA02_01145 [Enterobacteriaceae bacterium H20N1]|uniref:Uncharacterized protein n=1 Tax=Dryocola boscaweniae TaxID=2925397 RepID=A0A9X2W5S5_9ENTR|nr:hypothetical protein [Dryocola boscaweniae]MCT4700513.1 hypothetical protein [Dryocola boscaweniae]MCT4717669.1 hypothetical protein [Dryocola boscaweniae]